MKLYRPVAGKPGDFRMTQWFGQRPDVYWPMGFKGHMGIDYAGKNPGDIIPIYSATDGVCTIVDSGDKGYGKHIKVDTVIDWRKYTLLYGHLSDICVKNWETVKPMQKIGMMGTTWFSNGVHLHFEIKDETLINNGYKWRFDPIGYITNWDSTIVQPEATWHPVDTLWEQIKPCCFWKDYSDTAILTGWQMRKMQDIFARNFEAYLIKKYNLK